LWLKNPSSFWGQKEGRNCGWEIPILLGIKKGENCQMMVEKT
jgi:hypothetical protein